MAETRFFSLLSMVEIRSSSCWANVLSFRLLTVGKVLEARDWQSAVVTRDPDRNVVGGVLMPCSTEPLTGFYRDGCCATGPEDVGSHTVCSVVTDAFLEFSRVAGNDLSTPRPEWGFEGLVEGDRWCVCADRWAEAERAGCAPSVVLGATHVGALEHVPIETLTAYAFESDAAS